MFSTSLNTSSSIPFIEKCSIHVQNMESAVGFLRGYISPVLVLFGVFGNMSAFYLFLTHKPWNRFSIYVITLAISDSLVLITNTFLDDFLGRGLYYITNQSIIIKLDTFSLLSCQLMELIGTWFVFNSGCLLVAFSIDRVNCLYWPLKCRSNGGVNMAICYIVCDLIVNEDEDVIEIVLVDWKKEPSIIHIDIMNISG
ncbi:putative g-protein coupled receptor fragment [Schistosoma mansoni]|uniref:putative g-protein coupled receptor fragment n=1 Tax=Schistosoma mansoni TaxID=6183 RepID=UPI0001A61ACE|nr:putative g-protein coupled receptor fragment [Schistosoma mansoni]